MRNIYLILKNNFTRNMGSLLLIATSLLILSKSLSAGSIFWTNDTIDASGAPVGLLDYDETDLSKDLFTYLSDTLNMEVSTPASLHKSEEEAESIMTDLLINKEISAIIEVPKGFENAVISGDIKELSYTSLSDYENAAFLKIYLDNYMSKVQILSQSCNQDQTTFTNILQNSHTTTSSLQCSDTQTLTVAKQQGSFTISSGVFMMFSMGIATFVALAVCDDRKKGTYNRMQISPLKPSEYVIGTTLAGVLAGILFSACCIGLIVINHISMGVPMWLYAVMLLLFTLFSVGFALIMALTLKSKGLIFASISSSATMLAILGGAWFPVDKEQILLSRIAALTPHYWFMELIRSMQKDPQYQYVPSLIMLALFAALTYLIAAALFTKKE